MKASLLVVFGLSANLFLLGCADDLARSQISDTNAKLLQLQGNVGVLDNKVSNQKLIDIINKLDDLQSQVNQLNGNVATIKDDQKTYAATQDQLYKGVQQQIEELQHSLGQKTVESATGNVSNNANSDKLKSALSKIKNRKFPIAIKELKQVIGSSNDDSEIASASYYLTVSYAANNQYKEAIATGHKFIANYPDNKYAPDVLRTVYISQNYLGMKKSAIKTAKQIATNYPTSDAFKKIQSEK